MLGLGCPKQAFAKIATPRNQLYLGKIRHVDKWYPGQHQAIVDQDMWDKVHAIMATNRIERAADVRRQTPAPLKGLLFGPNGKAMTPTHTKRGDKKYRYYVTHTAQKRGYEECPIRMIRAGDIEGIVFDQIKNIFKNPSLIISTWSVAKTMDDGITEDDIRDGLQNIETVWDHLYHKEQARLLQLFIEKIRVEPEGIHIDIRTNGINSLVLDLKAAAIETKEMSA
ncbi:resolvase domain-containing protein [methanotrophic bacterial endosymbiont of Bathymodiolus sp.]|nr:resolvase domain-containing protein [methanotrophic bacterial endosymbiont of Bathymodiolus sp.]